MSFSSPTNEDIEELLISCRYGDVEDIQLFLHNFGPDPLATARDDNGNSVLHMVAANGHADALDVLLPLVPSSLLCAQNNAGSTPLHWAALNSYLSVAQKLVLFPGGPGVDLIDVKNAPGRSPLGEAENAGWEEGAKWFVEVMNLNVENKTGGGGDADGEELEPADGADRIEVEIQDAEGQVAKMTLGQSQMSSSKADEQADDTKT